MLRWRIVGWLLWGRRWGLLLLGRWRRLLSISWGRLHGILIGGSLPHFGGSGGGRWRLRWLAAELGRGAAWWWGRWYDPLISAHRMRANCLTGIEVFRLRVIIGWKASRLRA